MFYTSEGQVYTYAFLTLGPVYVMLSRLGLNSLYLYLALLRYDIHRAKQFIEIRCSLTMWCVTGF